MTNRSPTSLIMGLIGQKRQELFTLKFGKEIALYIFYTLASTNINQSAPNLINLIKMYMSIRSQLSWIIGQFGQDRSELSALKLDKNAIFDLVNFLASTDMNQFELAANVVKNHITI